jgi:hypothetical protein
LTKKRERAKNKEQLVAVSLSLSLLCHFFSLSTSLSFERGTFPSVLPTIFYIDGRPPYKGRKGDGGRWQAKLSEKTPDSFFFLQGLFIPKSLSLSLSLSFVSPNSIKTKKSKQKGA